MKRNVRKIPRIRISTYVVSAAKRGRIHRFSKWCAERYGISWRGVYESFRGSNTPLWKREGIVSCIKEYDSGKAGLSPCEFWNLCTRSRFSDFMSTKQMCRSVVWKRFTADDWNELELQGIRNVYQDWLKNVEKEE